MRSPAVRFRPHVEPKCPIGGAGREARAAGARGCRGVGPSVVAIVKLRCAGNLGGMEVVRGVKVGRFHPRIKVSTLALGTGGVLPTSSASMSGQSQARCARPPQVNFRSD